METSLSFKLVVLLFLVFIKYSTSTLERCDSNVDCDEGFICCKITKICASNCTKTCREDSDCGSGKCCNSNNTCTETNCSKYEDFTWQLILILLGSIAILPTIVCCASYWPKKWYCDCVSESSSSTTTSWRGGGFGSSGGYGGDCGGGGDGGGCGGDGGGGCGA